MKKVKYIISFFLLSLSLILNCELYQSYLESCTINFYYIMAEYLPTDECEVNVCQAIKNKSNEYNVKPFAITKDVKSAFTSEITIYAENETAKALKDEYGIFQGEFKSIFSGKTTVNIKSMDEFTADENVPWRNFYFVGEIENIVNLRENIEDDGYFVSDSVLGEERNINQYAVIGVWVLVCVVLFLLTMLDIQFQKKENFVRISLGKAAGKLIIKNIIADLTVLVLMFMLIKFVLSLFAYTGYKSKLTFLLFAVTLVLNSLLYLSMLNYNYKQVLYGANIKNGLLSNCYVIKAISMMITVAVFSANITLLYENISLLSQYHKVDTFKNYQFVNIAQYGDSDENLMPGTDAFLYLNRKNEICYSIAGITSDNISLIIVDKKSAEVLMELSKDEIDSIPGDYRVYYPKNDNIKKKFAEDMYEHGLDYVLPLKSETKGDCVAYSGNKTGIYFNFNVGEFDESISGFFVVKQPVFLVCNFDKEMFGKNEDDIDFIDFCNVMYLVTENDINEMVESLDSLKGCRIDSMPVVERCNEYRSNIERTILLSFVISVFMLFLEIAIISTIIRLEYTINATELALKKVLGYSIYKRNSMIFKLNIFSALIGIITVIVATLMAKFAEILGLSHWYSVVVAGIILLLIEWPVMIFYIVKTEKVNVAKILKGGSL